MRELLFAIVAFLLIGLPLSLLIKVTIAAAKLAIAFLLSFLLIAACITLTIVIS